MVLVILVLLTLIVDPPPGGDIVTVPSEFTVEPKSMPRLPKLRTIKPPFPSARIKCKQEDVYDYILGKTEVGLK